MTTSSPVAPAVASAESLTPAHTVSEHDCAGWDSCPNPAHRQTASTTAAMGFDYVSVHDVYGALANGGSISVEEFPAGEIIKAAEVAGRDSHNGDDEHAPLVLRLTTDPVGGAPQDTVWFHPDQYDRLDVIARARAALDAAEAALLSVGHVDNAHTAGARLLREYERS